MHADQAFTRGLYNFRFISSQIRADDDKYSKFQQLIETNKLNEFKIEYSAYNWAINSKN